MEKEKVIFFLDYANINRTVKGRRYQFDYRDLLHYIGEDRFLVDAHCYVPINPRNEHRADRAIEDLWRAGYMVHTKMGSITGGAYRCHFAVEITMDVMKVVYQMKPDIIVFASGDADFAALLHEVRKAGVRVEVAAFEETAGIDLQLKCSGFINLAVYYASYLATQNGEHDQMEESIEEEPYKELTQVSARATEEDDMASAQPDDKTPVPIPASVSEEADTTDDLESIDELTL